MNDMTQNTTPIRDNNVLTWATDVDAQTMAQAHRTASLDFCLLYTSPSPRDS